MAGRLTTRLRAVEKRLRPIASSGITDVLLTVPRAELGGLGEPCASHLECSVRKTGRITTHFMADRGLR
jgi:hypothetical protein